MKKQTGVLEAKCEGLCEVLLVTDAAAVKVNGKHRSNQIKLYLYDTFHTRRLHNAPHRRTVGSMPVIANR